MSLSLPGAVEGLRVGNDAAWLLAFYNDGNLSGRPVAEFGRDHYNAEIQATLPGGLEGGTYSIAIEGLTDADYARISLNNASPPRAAKLYMFWRDTNLSVGGYLANVAGISDLVSGASAETIGEQHLVAVLHVAGVTRKAGSRRYETTITLRERVFEKVNRPLRQGACYISLAAAVRALLVDRAGLAADGYQLHPLTPHPACAPSDPPAPDGYDVPGDGTILDRVREIGRLIEQRTGRYGRGMFLIRNGRLHLGPRPIPLSGDPRPLTPSAGLLATEPLDPIRIETRSAEGAAQTRTRRQLKLTLKGRPDIKPGDLVQADPPAGDEGPTMGGLLGSLGALIAGPLLPGLSGELQRPVTLYVASVEHRLGRASGFVTTVTGVEVTDARDHWDCRSERDQADSDQEDRPAAASPALRAASGVRGAGPTPRQPEVAEVRRANSATTGTTPGQTTTLWRGLVAPDGGRNAARRLAIRRPGRSEATEVPYLTPFAWGRCGLVLPRYPGTRILVSYPGGQANDPVDAGALWESGRGPDASPGDWWLILPVGVATTAREAASGEGAPALHEGKVSQDLIDADGNRVIEVGELTVRIGRDSLKNAGQRPARGEDGAVTIEHAKGQSSIVMLPDGTIRISGKRIELDAGDGDITMSAKSVLVSVQDKMDVS
jgi:hypothetical protein